MGIFNKIKNCHMGILENAISVQDLDLLNGKIHE